MLKLRADGAGMAIFAQIAELTDRFPWDFLSGLGQGTALGMLIVGALFTSRLGPRLLAGKQELFKKIRKN